MATVTGCHYEFGAGHALAFGLPKRKQFQISFNYWADGTLHTGEFASSKAVPQGTLFPVSYNPDAAHEHSHDAASQGNPWLIVVAVAGLALISALTALTARGCAN